MKLAEPWRSIVVAISMGVSAHFGTLAMQGPQVEGGECARMLMQVVAVCDQSPCEVGP